MRRGGYCRSVFDRSQYGSIWIELGVFTNTKIVGQYKARREYQQQQQQKENSKRDKKNRQIDFFWVLFWLFSSFQILLLEILMCVCAIVLFFPSLLFVVSSSQTHTQKAKTKTVKFPVTRSDVVDGQQDNKN